MVTLSYYYKINLSYTYVYTRNNSIFLGYFLEVTLKSYRKYLLQIYTFISCNFKHFFKKELFEIKF